MQILFLAILAHMRMSVPATRGFNYDTAPISSDQFPCKGLAPVDPTPIKAGSTIESHIHGTANHGGGICQWSLSYDEGETFVVIHTIDTGCPAPEADYQLPIPLNIPNGKSILLWSWMNEIGNREFYANCADIIVSGSSGTDFKGPQILVGNIEHSGKLISLPENKVSSIGKQYLDNFAKHPVGFVGHGSIGVEPSATLSRESRSTETYVTDLLEEIEEPVLKHLMKRRRNRPKQ
eukprot:NODE_267_length_11298_cov_1.167872.p7 type:complete len:235 gc:universal NODE_267_length_11298_cov_1.167872:6273-5569(-)